MRETLQRGTVNTHAQLRAHKVTPFVKLIRLVTAYEGKSGKRES